MMKRDEQLSCHDIITSEDYIDIVDVGSSGDFPEGVCVQQLESQIQILHMHTKVSCVKDYLTIPFIAARLPNVFGISMEYSDNAQPNKLSSEEAFSKLGLAGNNVLIGIIDTGIDYTHPAFIYRNNTTKIVSIWDQAVKGVHPKGIEYGAEYTREQINEALASDDPYSIVPQKDDIGHGTFMAGAAAGIPRESDQFSSVAPNAELLIVKLKQAKKCLQEFFFTDNKVAYQDTDILMGMKYLFDKSRELNKPIVIVFAGQSYIGAHTSSDVDPIEILASNYGKSNGVAFVFSAGDQANKGLHYRGNFFDDSEKTVTKRTVQYNVQEGEEGIAYNLWVKEPDQLTVNLISPKGSETGKIPYKSNVIQEYTFLLEETVIYTDFVFRQRFGGQQALYFRIDNPTPGIWTMEVFGDVILSGQFNIWLGIYQYLKEGTRFLKSDPDTTVVVPSTTENVITVGAYNISNRGVYTPSGRGFTVDNKVKPDIVASGVDILSTLPGNKYGIGSGTAVATAVAAGGVAQLLEWGIVDGNNTSIDTVVAKSYLIGGAYRSKDITYPNKDFGYGKMDIYNSITGGLK